MKKLILILLTIITSCTMNALENPTGFTYPIPSFSYDVTDQNSPFYDQDQAHCKKQIKGARAIITQYQALNDVYTATQFHKIKNQSDLITQITTVYEKAQQELSGIKADDLLINNKKLLEYANIYQPISLENTPTYILILLAQEYITSGHALSHAQKLVLWNQINPLLIAQPLLWQDLSAYNPQSIEEFSLFLPMVYDKIWNSYKFIITSRLLQTLNTEKAKYALLTSQFSGINEMRTTVQRQADQYDNALIAIHSKEAQTVVAETVTTPDVPAHTECIEADSQVDVVTATEIDPVAENRDINLQNQVIVTAPVTEKNVIVDAPKKSLALSKKQLAALAAEKKAEQSRIDKERHRLALEQKKAEEAKKLIPTTPVLAAVTKSSSSKTAQKKSVNKTNKKQEQTTDEDIDAILNLAIAENNSKCIEKDIAQLNQAIASQINSDASSSAQNSAEAMIEQPEELRQYHEFIEARNKEILKLEQAKEVQRKINLKKMCSIKAQDKERVKHELETALNKNFNMKNEAENEIILLLNAYACSIDRRTINTMPLESFKIIEHKIIGAEKYLREQGHCLKWYLAAHPAIYASIKEKYIKFRAVMEQTAYHQELLLQSEFAKNPALTDAEKATMRQEVYAPLHKQEAILESLKKFHTDNGIFDITRLIYPIKTHDELAAMGTLSPAVLEQAQKDIKFLYVSKKSIDFFLIQPIIDNLMHQANIATPPQNLVKDMINMSAMIVQSKGNKNKLFSELDKNIFYSLQRNNEMSITPFTDAQMADITKIHMAVLSTLVEIEQARS